MQRRLTAGILCARLGIGVDILQVVILAVLGGVGAGLDLDDEVWGTFIESIVIHSQRLKKNFPAA